MSEHPDTQVLVRHIVEGLVDNPGDIAVERIEDGRDVTYEISVHGDDVGKVIGRQGRIIRAIRVLVRAAGVLHGEQVYVEVLG